jgi:hypothetical protein
MEYKENAKEKRITIFEKITIRRQKLGKRQEIPKGVFHRAG